MLTQQAVERLNLEQGIKEALRNNEFSLNIQPKVDAKTGQVKSGEVLIRWKRDEQWISPAHFIPVAEESGYINAIGEWVLSTVCEQWVNWTHQGHKPHRLAVNISAQQFIQPGFVKFVANTLASTGMPANQLELEITEEVAGQHPEMIIQTMKELKSLGVFLSIDDFGTGYSSLSYLTRFPVDTLKIDRAFVSDMDTDENNYAIVKMITSLASELKMSVVAEGVENKHQQELLVELECDYIQGYYFYKPLNLDEYKQLI
jgi:EAL domain-containing protein (putative c-di-GMP-specific phosphodiesterase class I)